MTYDPQHEMDDLFPLISAPNEVVLAVGGEGSGKTHFAATAPGPLYLIGTEAGHEAVTIARAFPDKPVRHLKLKFKDFEPEVYKGAPIWYNSYQGAAEQMQEAVLVLMDAAKGTVIIDSASDLLGIAAASFAYKMNREGEPIPSMLYSQVYPIVAGWINALRHSHNVVLTARLKEEYRKNEKTGRMTTDIFKTGPYLADTIVHISVMEPPNSPPIRVGRVTKGAAHGRAFIAPDWERVVSGVDDDTRLVNGLGRFMAAIDYCAKRGIEVDTTLPETAEELDRRLAEIKERIKPTKNEVAA